MDLNVFVACDSFKGSLSSTQANQCVEKGIRTIFKNANIESVPIADGGEGTVDACVYNGGHKEKIQVQDEMVEIGIDDETGTCFIEMASVNGILQDRTTSIYDRNTYKTGLLIQKVIQLGYQNVVIGIGGSGTNDCGMGMAYALGYCFLDDKGNEVEPFIRNARSIQTIDNSKVNIDFKKIHITVLSDVKNQLLGKKGCAYVYGKQKGASLEDMQRLEELDSCFYSVCKENHYCSQDFEGAGAAGGLGFGLVSFLNAHIVSGIDYVLSRIEKEEEMENFDLIITGEGRIDEQSLCGKVIYGMKELGKKYDIPVLAIGGSVELENSQDLFYGSCVQKCCDVQEAIQNAQTNLIHTTIQCMNLIYCGMKIGGNE